MADESPLRPGTKAATFGRKTRHSIDASSLALRTGFPAIGSRRPREQRSENKHVFGGRDPEQSVTQQMEINLISFT